MFAAPSGAPQCHNLCGGRNRIAVVESRFDDVFELGEIGGAHLNSLNFVVYRGDGNDQDLIENSRKALAHKGLEENSCGSPRAGKEEAWHS